MRNISRIQKCQTSSNSQTFAWIDNVFRNHKDDAVIIIERKRKESDFKCKYLGYNKKILKFITKDEIENAFKEEFIKSCLKIFVGKLNKKEFQKLINTFIGELKVYLHMSFY